MNATRSVFLRTLFAVAVMALAAPVYGNAQTCGLCKKHTTGDCNIPTSANSCGCCPMT